ncbi:MAG: hypothetical protein HOO19_00885 [Rhodospirillaceae bacterium]|jgi:hypothetical protein|nr:hypothetical protein [Rhodospirillaceae bacterium]MBT4118285.1 hypothetical protein [Rhodospirillaceae bacterium]MBT4747855.1 hypothetical protein [Rhodospirillaceae bacterium]MBT6861140.1 hypothetical protein [Rhodospirillaceae bacterium]MBT7030323.1 hypothetical protein [Rhodospirillaceae bacterium]
MPGETSRFLNDPTLLEAFNEIGIARFSKAWTPDCIGLSHGQYLVDSDISVLFDPDEYDELDDYDKEVISRPTNHFKLATPHQVKIFYTTQSILLEALWGQNLECYGIDHKGSKTSIPREVWRDFSGEYEIVIADSSLHFKNKNPEVNWQIRIDLDTLAKLKGITEQVRKLENRKLAAKKNPKGGLEPNYKWDFIIKLYVEIKQTEPTDTPNRKCAKLVQDRLKNMGWDQSQIPDYDYITKRYREKYNKNN